MHIVQLLPELNQGGVERGTVEFSRELILGGHTSTVISAGGTLAGQIDADGGRHITLDVCSKNPITAPTRILRLRKILHELKPDILHARSRVPAWLSWFANKPLNLPFITTVHGFNSVSKYSEIMLRGDRVIYGSSAIKEYITEHYTMDESILRYVPRGIDTAYFDPSAIDQSFIEHFLNEHQLSGKRVITIVGRITEWKGHDCFIRALARVQKDHPDLVGLIVGGVWHDKSAYLQSLKTLAVNCDAKVHFVGSQSQVREIYSLSDFVVSAASTKPETFGRTAAEALAMNTPVIASAHGGSLDILLDGINGFLFEPGNADDLELKIRTVLAFSFSKMREHIENKFSLTHMTETELAVYSDIL
jgi:glycosyltransferase involved in cell wall biosynthesis